MSDHEQLNELLPLYVSGKLADEARRRVAAHLLTCAECQADLALWGAVAVEVKASNRALAAPAGLAERALRQARFQPRRSGLLRRAVRLLRAQAPLVRRELWPASAAVLVIGCMVALLARNSGVLRILSPLVAAACVSLIFGKENDPAVELELSTPTSPRQILLARLALVFGYNFVLSLVASLALAPLFKTGSLAELVLGWLGPMALLSSAALLLSMFVGASNAVAIAYLAWLAQFVPDGLTAASGGQALAEVSQALGFYQQFWQQPLGLLALSALLVAAAVWFAGRGERITANYTNYGE